MEKTDKVVRKANPSGSTVKYTAKEAILKAADENIAKLSGTEFFAVTYANTYALFDVKAKTIGIPIEKRWAYLISKEFESCVRFCKISLHRGMSWLSYTSDSKSAVNNWNEYVKIAQALNIGVMGVKNSAAVSPATIVQALGPLMKLLATADKMFSDGKTNVIHRLGGRLCYPGIIGTELFSDKKELDDCLRVEAAIVLAKQVSWYIETARAAAKQPVIGATEKKTAVLKSLGRFHYQFSGYSHETRVKINEDARNTRLRVVLASDFSIGRLYNPLSEMVMNDLCDWICGSEVSPSGVLLKNCVEDLGLAWIDGHTVTLKAEKKI